MFNIIEAIILSDVLVTLILIIMLGAVTTWSMRRGEYPGYILGWLAGILLVMIYRTLMGEPPEPDTAEEIARETRSSLNFFVVFVSVGTGLIVGYGVILITQLFVTSRGRRGLTTALMTASLLLSIYMLTIVGEEFRRVLGLFFLAMSVGVLLKVVMGPMRRQELPVQNMNAQSSLQPPPFNPQNNYPPQPGAPPVAPPDAPPSAPPANPSSGIQRRFDQLRRRYNRDR